jgi:hypothetical protein
MEQQSNRIRIELTDAQRKQIKEQSGEEVQAFEFTVQELEQRIAPAEFMKWTLSDVVVTSA